MIYFCLIIFISGFFDAIRDLIYAYDTFKDLGFWWSREAWVNKHKLNRKGLLVFTTDAWHFFKYLFNIFLIIGISLLSLSGVNIYLLIGVSLLSYLLGFSITYESFKRYY